MAFKDYSQAFFNWLKGTATVIPKVEIGEVPLISGLATGGTKTTLVDSANDFAADIFNDGILKMTIGGKEYYRKISDTADSTLTFPTLPGTVGTAVWTITTGVTITVVSVADGFGGTIAAALNAEPSKNLAVALVGDVVTVTLATNSEGASDDAKNTVTLVTAAIDALTGFTATAAGEGSTVVGATETPIDFEGGVAEVKPIAGTPYQIVKDSNKVIAQIDQTTSGTTNKVIAELTGSNLRVTASDTITMGGTGVGAHTALDVVSTQAGEILEFDTGLPAGSSGVILSSLVTLNQNAVFSGGAGYYLHLYNAAPTAIADNAAYTLAAADLAKYIGKITISTLIDRVDNCVAHDVGHNMDFTLASADTKLYGILVCIGGETTINEKVLTIKLGVAAL